ncbi:hypothetical protein [Lysinibacillus sp. fls2-241-R2A-57]|uniref:hypothetical protein n=1 Tax=Lysinibacillus sp. fls2-241-R2A-57 TaxID=3040292 RepID=UPI00255276CD|nr:hypothetical protein [Lysinibacillus sp. fls2-241-R2A-57]
METVHIPNDAEQIISTSSKGNQSKWRIGNTWVKQNARGYEGQAEVLASLILECSTLNRSKYVVYQPCIIELADGEQFEGCYSLDFRGTKQEGTLEPCLKQISALLTLSQIIKHFLLKKNSSN